MATKKAISNIVNHAEVSEKMIERYLCEVVAKLGGVCLKYSNPNMVGYPDRLAVMPGGGIFWVELKSKGCKRTRIQEIRCEQLMELGQSVYVADSKDKVNEIVRGLGYEI